jgi:hypothetical protein
MIMKTEAAYSKIPFALSLSKGEWYFGFFKMGTHMMGRSCFDRLSTNGGSL